NPATDVFTKKLDFNGANGANPRYGALIEVKKAVIWTTANEWSNVVGPTIDDVTIIEGDLAVGTDFGDFSAKSLTIRAGGSLVIEPGHVVRVNAQITNLATEADFVVESGANLVQLKDFQNEGSATVKRESAPIVRLDYTAWGAPVEGQNLLDFSPQTLPNRFYTYDYTGTTTATAWIPVADPSTTNFEPSHGYLLRAPNNWSSSVYTPYQGEFIGKPNNGSFQNTVGVGYNLLGNPYPSPLSADAFLTENAALGVSSLYYWTHAVPQNGAYVPQTNYASYNLSGGTAAIAGGAQPDEFIQVGQGFLVNIATAGQAQFSNAQRSDNSNNQFFRTTTTNVDRFWLGLRTDNASYNQMLVAYINGATDGIDLGYDAKLLTNGNSHLASLINNENYVIQGRNSVFEVNDEVPLSFTAEQSGMFTISLDAVEGIFDSQDILLWDKQLNIYHNLQTNDYSFTTNAGTFNNRFSVVYNSTLSNPTFNEAAILVYKNNEHLIISSNNETLQNVKVYDIQGRLLVHKQDINASMVTILEINAKNQVLLVDIQTENGSVTKKIGF
ncbi:MAG: T9SS sorting signal type C domain-containing protein, partial [Bacteroidales bacterium]